MSEETSVATADRRLSERRYKIGVLIGPCSSDEAEALMEQIGNYVYDDLGGPLGACVSMSGCVEDPKGDPA